MAFLFAIMLSLSAFLIGYSIYDFGKKNFLRETEEILDIEIANIIFNTLNFDINDKINYLSRKSLIKEKTLYHYTDVDNNYLAGNFANPNLENAFTIKKGVIGLNLFKNGEESRFAGKTHTFEDGSKILVSKNINNLVSSYKKLRLYSIITFFFMIIVVMISFFLSTFVVSRINIIANTAKSIIQSGDLSKRIVVDSKWDDMSYLSQTLNQMLEKIQTLMNGIKNVTNNIAHDLRTPLARLRNNLESLDTEKKQDVQHLVNECDNIIGIFNSLLQINKVEKGNILKQKQELKLNQIIEDVIDLYGPIAEQKNIQVVNLSKTEHIIYADRNLIFQMIANLVDNGIKYSKENSLINIDLQNSKEFITFSIADQGVGVKENELDKIFDRFYRTEQCRSTPGNGLGLSLVKAIVDLHSAKINVENNNPGLKISVSFKA